MSSSRFVRFAGRFAGEISLTTCLLMGFVMGLVMGLVVPLAAQSDALYRPLSQPIRGSEQGTISRITTLGQQFNGFQLLGTVNGLFLETPEGWRWANGISGTVHFISPEATETIQVVTDRAVGRYNFATNRFRVLVRIPDSVRIDEVIADANGLLMGAGNRLYSPNGDVLALQQELPDSIWRMFPGGEGGTIVQTLDGSVWQGTQQNWQQIRSAEEMNGVYLAGVFTGAGGIRYFLSEEQGLYEDAGAERPLLSRVSGADPYLSQSVALLAKPMRIPAPLSGASPESSTEALYIGLEDGTVLVLNGDLSLQARYTPADGLTGARVQDVLATPNGFTVATDYAIVKVWPSIRGRLETNLSSLSGPIQRMLVHQDWLVVRTADELRVRRLNQNGPFLRVSGIGAPKAIARLGKEVFISSLDGLFTLTDNADATFIDNSTYPHLLAIERGGQFLVGFFDHQFDILPAGGGNKLEIPLAGDVLPISAPIADPAGDVWWVADNRKVVTLNLDPAATSYAAQSVALPTALEKAYEALQLVRMGPDLVLISGAEGFRYDFVKGQFDETPIALPGQLQAVAQSPAGAYLAFRLPGQEQRAADVRVYQALSADAFVPLLTPPVNHATSLAVLPSGELLQAGLVGLRTFRPQQAATDTSFAVRMSVQVSDSVLWQGPSESWPAFTVPYRFNRLKLTVLFAGAYPPGARWRYRLLGTKTPVWSGWTPVTTVQLEPLLEGDYSLEIELMDGLGNRARPQVYPFSVQPPLYRDWRALAGGGLVLFMVIYLLTRKLERRKQRRLQREKDTLTAEVAARTREVEAQKRHLAEQNEALQAANDELAQQKRALEEAYQENREKQKRLVLSEKLAVLGRLTPSLAHEINTPAGTVQASAQALVDALPKTWLNLAHDYPNLPAEAQIAFWATVEAITHDPRYPAPKEERIWRDNLKEALRDLGVPQPDDVARVMVRAGIPEPIPELVAALRDHAGGPTLLSLMAEFGRVWRPLPGISAAATQIQEVLEALRVYTRPRADAEKKIPIPLQKNLELVLRVYRYYVMQHLSIEWEAAESLATEGHPEQLMQVWTTILTHLADTAEASETPGDKVRIELKAENEMARVSFWHQMPAQPLTADEEQAYWEVAKGVLHEHGGELSFQVVADEQEIRVVLPRLN